MISDDDSRRNTLRAQHQGQRAGKVLAISSAMIQHKIDDIRRLYNSDQRFLQQF